VIKGSRSNRREATRQPTISRTSRRAAWGEDDNEANLESWAARLHDETAVVILEPDTTRTA
jgi:hypothetical protein